MSDDHREGAGATDPREVTIPLAMLLAGIAVLFVRALVTEGSGGVAMALLGIGAEIVIGVPLAIVACFAAARVLDTDFGLLHTAVLKLAAAFIFPAAVAGIIPIGLLAWIVSLILYLGMLEKFFRLEPTELIVCAILIFLVRILAGVVVAMLVLA
ncbi:MAG: hypothetical protein CMJ18_13005 [Phycisphaeraceae bacterium]|nr:hypothetical protein [Phycisphaeraceae bacterium]